MGFESNLAFGRVAEGAIAKWIMSCGYSVLPAYEIEKHTGKGPQLFSAVADLVAPDMLCFGPKICWAEAKHKTVFSWHRNSQQWVTGIDLRHYYDYLEVQKATNIPVWLFFFHRSSTPAAIDVQHGCPDTCPTGLFGGQIDVLSQRESHQCLPLNSGRTYHKGHGRSGMVYWAESAFDFHMPLPKTATTTQEPTP